MGAGAVLAVFLLLVFVVNPLLGSARSAVSRAESAAEQHEALLRLRRRYDQLHGRLALVEARIAQGTQGELFTTLERLARQSSVAVDSMEPRTSSPNEDYRETKVQVAVKKVTLTQLVNYLHRIESEQQLLSIKSLRSRVRSDAPEFLEANFTVSSFEKI
jgi:hypothetical protein